MALNAPKTNDFLELAGQLVVESLIAALLSPELDIRRPVFITQKIRYQINRNEVLVYMPAYYRNIESGRKPGATPVPVVALVDWIQRKSVPVPPGMTILSLAYRIQAAIFRRGIRPKPFVAEAFDEATDELSIRIFGEIDAYIKETVKLFTTIPTGPPGN